MKPSRDKLYFLRMMPLRKGNFLAHNHVSWIFGLEIIMMEAEMRGDITKLEPLDPPVDHTHD